MLFLRGGKETYQSLESELTDGRLQKKTCQGLLHRKEEEEEEKNQRLNTALMNFEVKQYAAVLELLLRQKLCALVCWLVGFLGFYC
ncbi:hypothetical protein Y032_0156g3144 [Ancylostoma ceylanicum]|uniref:Uncharacterized protein n=1 Tax=Ancylostoma ceylanicum TaxID=53326 RepID=A0A016SZ83_9BILA|nr:hypothetical protein Y032_0156g3144 [Ancylostoma ceylanicum]